MVRNVPDEIIHEILSPGLFVADDAFTAISSSSPTRSSTESSSAILLVSKSWLRVATPLLYHTVILRSKGQAQALAAALRANPTLGRFIKKLRVEGGYAISMHKILQTAKNLTDICFGLQFQLGDNVCGLCRGLPLINPVRVVLAHTVKRGSISEQTRKFVDILVECIPKWKNLTTFVMPHDWQHIPEHRVALSNYLDAPLKAARNLRTLVLFDYELDLFTDAHIPSYIRTIAANLSLQEIRPRAPPSKALASDFLVTVQGDARLSTLIDLRLFGLSDHPFIYPPQLAADPELEDIVWGRVLSFLFRDYTPNDDADQRGRVSPLLVCKRFARLSIPYLYEAPCIRWTRYLPMLSQRLVDEPTLGKHVRRLFLFTYGRVDQVERILVSVPNLLGLTSNGDDGNSLPWKLFDDLSIRFGATLDTFRGFPVQKNHNKMDPAIFSRFERLRSLSWDCETRFYTSSNNCLDRRVEHPRGLVHRKRRLFVLQRTIADAIRLPSLRRLTVTRSADIELFLKEHGKKIEELTIRQSIFHFDIFKHCPSIKVLTINTRSDSAADQLPSMGASESAKLEHKHDSLECIVFQSTHYDSWKSHVNAVEKFLTDFDSTPFPALREIQHPAFRWNNSEKELLKSPWVKWAEKFRENYNIHLVCRRGAQWRLRRVFEPKKVNKKTRK
ncbi:hypothetical protein FB45DRAFT_464044 [Roridomyces roridus]|uniref:Uncharacterized protein n=1 Tax=Roridomyces roridus TaxID=1738132 RepID=A0AAD7B0E8_9AGAR|nr:hypothetical protein FB45DRAFT_464044 [Roridomyces roridus]